MAAGPRAGVPDDRRLTPPSPVPLDYLIFDPSSCRFPTPRTPPLATGVAGLSWRPAKTGSDFATGSFRYFTRARYALRQAYHLAGVGTGGALLAPSYHCRTMIDPALALDGPVVLYPLTPDLEVDLAALDRLHHSLDIPAKALLATHFFGLTKDFGELASWCHERNITLVEDCSHALFLETAQAPQLGRFGDFVVSSPYKFVPSPDGGLL